MILTPDPKKSIIEQLPPEILLQILDHVSHASSLARLSRTCKSLNEFVKTEGWSVFATSNFPSLSTSTAIRGSWQESARALTTLSRNFDRRALIATYPEPSKKILALPERAVKSAWQRPRGQTMGFQPMVDSYQVFTGPSWSSQKQVVAWGAGAEVVLCRTEGGREVAKQWRNASAEVRDAEFDQHRRRVNWATYRNPAHREGRDDVTALKLLKPKLDIVSKATDCLDERVVVGRATGRLDIVHLSDAPESDIIEQAFETGANSVKSLDIASEGDPVVAAGLDNDRVALYSCRDEEQYTSPISQVQCARRDGDTRATRIWSTTFLSNKGVFVGRGPATDIGLVYGIRPDGLSQDPVRVFGTGSAEDKKTAIYSVATFPDSPGSNSLSTDLFLSGGYDGLIRLHDMRDPHDAALVIEDPLDSAPIFSLVTVGRERAIAGGGIFNLLKFFDLRMAGGRTYSYIDPAQGKHIESPGWNVFGHSKQRGSLQSPIYSLSRPSPWSTSIFAGMENQVLHLNVSSAGDAHPDPLFRAQYTRHGHFSPCKTWNPDQRQVNEVSMYEQIAEGSGAFQMLKQDPIRFGRQPPRKPIPGYDERWSSNLVGRPQ